MDVKYILVALLIIIFIVNAVALLILNSQISQLVNGYNSLYNDYSNLKQYYNQLGLNYSSLYSMYSSLANSYNSLSAQYALLKADYDNLSTRYNQLAQNYSALSENLTLSYGIALVQSFYISLAQINTENIENLLKGPYDSYFQITSPPGNGTVILSSSNSTLAISIVGSQLSKFFGYLNVKTELKELIITPLGNDYLIGEGLVSFNNEYTNGTINTTYALITVTARNVNLTSWQVVYVKIDNSLSQQEYNMIVTVFNMLQAIQTKNVAQLQSILIGPYTSYVYIAEGPFAGNYTGLDVLNTFMDKILSNEIASFNFRTYYFNITPISPIMAKIDLYGILTIITVNGTFNTYYTNLDILVKLQPNGVPQVIGLNIINTLTQQQLISVIPKV